jgi:hypothetical protein
MTFRQASSIPTRSSFDLATADRSRASQAGLEQSPYPPCPQDPIRVSQRSFGIRSDSRVRSGGLDRAHRERDPRAHDPNALNLAENESRARLLPPRGRDSVAQPARLLPGLSRNTDQPQKPSNAGLFHTATGIRSRTPDRANVTCGARFRSAPGKARGQTIRLSRAESGGIKVRLARRGDDLVGARHGSEHCARGDRLPHAAPGRMSVGVWRSSGSSCVSSNSGCAITLGLR